MKKILSIIVIILGLVLTATQAFSSLTKSPDAPKTASLKTAPAPQKSQTEQEAYQHLKKVMAAEQKRPVSQAAKQIPTPKQAQKPLQMAQLKSCNKKGQCWTLYKVEGDNPAPKCNHCGAN